jgi:hypothetical protein
VNVSRRFTAIALSWLVACGGDTGPREGDATGESSGGTTTTTVTSADTGSSTQAADSSTGSPGTDSTGAAVDGSSSGGGEESSGGPPAVDWLLTLDQGNTPPQLVRIDVDTTESLPICDLPLGSAHTSVSFTADGTLYAFDAPQGRIESIDPCTCGFQISGATGATALEITDDGVDGLVGIDPTLAAYVTVDRDTGLTNVVGPLGVVLDDGAIAWSQSRGAPWLLDATADALLRIDPESGSATPIGPLGIDVAAPGFDAHPLNGRVYACSADELFELDVDAGTATSLGTLVLSAACDDLAAPRTAIACLDAPRG